MFNYHNAEKYSSVYSSFIQHLLLLPCIVHSKSEGTLADRKEKHHHVVHW